jgi:antitoxin VapB
MPISLKSPEAERLARELAAATGESITEAITRALDDRLARVRAEHAYDAGAAPGRAQLW